MNRGKIFHMCNLQLLIGISGKEKHIENKNRSICKHGQKNYIYIIGELSIINKSKTVTACTLLCILIYKHVFFSFSMVLYC